MGKIIAEGISRHLWENTALTCAVSQELGKRFLFYGVWELPGGATGREVFPPPPPAPGQPVLGRTVCGLGLRGQVQGSREREKAN